MISELWHAFCEKYLVAEDPYQYEQLTEAQLIRVFERHKLEGIKSKALMGELIRRLARNNLDIQTREQMSKALIYYWGESEQS